MPQPIDLLACPAASPQEVSEAIAASKELAAKDDDEPAPIKSTAPALVYRTIPRTPDDNASRLGFEVGPSEARPIKVGSRWTIHGFHLGSPQIIGALSVSLGVSAFNSQRLEVALFDGMGECVLRLAMRESHIRFDQLKLNSGDYLICFRSRGPGVEGTGSHRTPHSRLLEGELPTNPQIDDLIAEPSDVSLGDAATPRFTFSSGINSR